MHNPCVFSPDRRYRYLLVHRWDELFPEKACAIIGLNPSTAAEDLLDPTTTRLKDFCTAWGFNCFYMLNLFAFRATDPDVMKASDDPVGPDNDRWIRTACHQTECIVAAWGKDGGFRGRDRSVLRLLQEKPLFCFGLTKCDQPKHPLYLAKTTPLVPFNGTRARNPPVYGGKNCI